MGIIDLLEAKSKCFKVIESCETLEQLEVAKKYVELYDKKYEDFLGYNMLNRKIKENEEIINLR
jgi:hypothetical protein